MTTSKLTTILHNIYADHTDGCDPDDCWSTEIIEAYIAERVLEKLEYLATSDPKYTYAALKDEIAELKSNER